MLLPIKWLKDYVDFDFDVKKLADGLSNSGSHVESIIIPSEGLDKIVVERIEKIENHPDADKLVICSVNVGEEVLQIVTGAKNVFEGAIVPVALHGSTVAGGTKIKKGKLRGVESNGMLCSLEELGYETSVIPKEARDGIFIFPEGTEIGGSAMEALFMDNEILELEITPNRPDCLSIMGMAVETAASFDLKARHKEIKIENQVDDFSDYFDDIEIDTENCTRYYSKILKNIKIGPSPLWLQAYLMQAGVRPISNIVDLTNFVMLEYGQPLHAFDLDSLHSKKIVVRMAKDGEETVTLDGETRKLESDDILITDGQEIIGLAGIMGGLDSEITDKTVNVLLEGANFNKENIRKASRRLNLRSEASSRFEKGLDPNNAKAAIDRACQLIEEMGAGEVVGGTVDVYSKVKEPVRVPFDADKINAMLGTDLSEEQMLAYFEKIDLGYDPETKEVIAPTFRHDLFRIADLAEEVARFYGYDNIPTTLPSGEATAGKLSFKLRIEQIARDIAEFCGFSEGMSYSFESPKVFDKLLIPADSELRRTVDIMNPLGEDYSVMRTVSLNGMLTSLATNYNRRNKNVRLYELGNIYLPKQLPLTELPEERMQFTLGMYGDGDFFTMKGVVEEFFEKIGMKQRETYDPNAGKPYLHPGRQANIIYDGKVVGYLGEVHPEVADTYGIGERAYVAVIDMPEILEYATFDRKYEGIAKYPAVSRDISMVVPKEILVGQIEDVIAAKGGKYLESFALFDLYEGAQIKDGYKSVAYTIVFRAKDRTLEEADVSASMEKILKALEEMGIELRK